MNFRYRLGFVGFGNMANAILNGILREGLLRPDEMGAFDADEDKRSRAEALGLKAFSNNEELAKNCTFILLAVKPQSAGEIFGKIDFSGNTLISIMAGIPLSKLTEKSGCPRIARCMPNTPCMVGKGAIAVDAHLLNREERDFVLSVLASTGRVVEMPDEKMDAVTAVSGSGPAYVYLFMKAMAEEGVRLGLAYDQAKALTAATFEGAASLWAAGDRDIDALIDSVCSKGGTTIEAVKSFRADGVEEMVARAMEKCYHRSVELGK